MSDADSLMQFRITYLRAIARAWNDPAFLKELLECPNVFGILQQEFGFCYPWPYLELRLAIDQNFPSVWQPVQTAGWIGPNDKFVLYLPPAPPSEPQWTPALAAYYQLFPTLFGPSRRLATAAPPPQQGVALETSASGGDTIFGSGGTLTDFLTFGAVMLRALALSWKDPQFQHALYADGLNALNAWLGYNSPWNFTVDISMDTTATWSPQSGRWSNLSNNRIEMNFPNAPKEFETSVWPIALTAYNSTGPQYPFTCE